MKPVEKYSKKDIEALLYSIDDKATKKIMRAATLSEKKKSIGDSPDSKWADIDLPDPTEKKNIKLSKKQKVVENMLKKSMINMWDTIFKIAVEKKRRKIMLTKDEYSIDYDIVNRRELMLPPEYYLNLSTLEKYYVSNLRGKEYDMDVSTLRMFLSMRFDIRGNLIHLANISKFLNIPLTNLVRKRSQPIENKLLVRVKKRLKLKNVKKAIIIEQGHK